MKLSVVYDGPSRPMLATDDKPPRLFSISEFIDGKWQSFDDEDAICELIANAMSGLKLVCAQHRQFASVEGDEMICPICSEQEGVAARR